MPSYATYIYIYAPGYIGYVMSSLYIYVLLRSIMLGLLRLIFIKVASAEIMYMYMYYKSQIHSSHTMTSILSIDHTSS